MSSTGLFHLEVAAGTVPDTQFFEGDSAFKSFGVTRTQRLIGFAGWCVLQIDKENYSDLALVTSLDACSAVPLWD